MIFWCEKLIIEFSINFKFQVLVAVVAVAYSQEGGYGGHQGQQQGYGHGHATSYIEQNLHNKEEKEVHIKVN